MTNESDLIHCNDIEGELTEKDRRWINYIRSLPRSRTEFMDEEGYIWYFISKTIGIFRRKKFEQI